MIEISKSLKTKKEAGQNIGLWIIGGSAYDEAINNGISNREEYGKEALDAIQEFRDKCESGMNKFEAFVKVFVQEKAS